MGGETEVTQREKHFRKRETFVSGLEAAFGRWWWRRSQRGLACRPYEILLGKFQRLAGALRVLKFQRGDEREHGATRTSALASYVKIQLVEFRPQVDLGFGCGGLAREAKNLIEKRGIRF